MSSFTSQSDLLINWLKLILLNDWLSIQQQLLENGNQNLEILFPPPPPPARPWYNLPFSRGVAPGLVVGGKTAEMAAPKILYVQEVVTHFIM